MRRRHVGARGDGGVRLHDLFHDGVAHLCRAGAYAPRQRRGVVGIRGVAGAECVACRDAVVAGDAESEAGVFVGGVRVAGVGLEVGPAPVAPVIGHLDAVTGDVTIAVVAGSGPREVDLSRLGGDGCREAGRRAGDGDARRLPGHRDGIGLHRAAHLGRNLHLDDVRADGERHVERVRVHVRVDDGVVAAVEILHRRIAAGRGRRHDEGGDRAQHRRCVGVRVRVEFRVQGAGAQRKIAQRREGPGVDDRHRDGVGAVRGAVRARGPPLDRQRELQVACGRGGGETRACGISAGERDRRAARLRPRVGHVRAPRAGAAAGERHRGPRRHHSGLARVRHWREGVGVGVAMQGQHRQRREILEDVRWQAGQGVAIQPQIFHLDEPIENTRRQAAQGVI